MCKLFVRTGDRLKVYRGKLSANLFREALAGHAGAVSDELTTHIRGFRVSLETCRRYLKILVLKILVFCQA
jgi:hypothetical protein